ncbi:MAG: sodium/proline symporter [Clostridiales bacterium]|nr:sodium/proline symporter [Clostridiales bacterium]MDO5139948.1 sodium/proline symporter [Eubacteriales bacterium]
MLNAEMIVFIAYFVILFFVGLIFYFNGSNQDQEDYFLGGRSMGPWVTAMSAQASDMSAWLLMGLPGSVLAFGFGQIWIGIGLALGTAANWIFCAKRLRKFSKAANDAITLPQYLTNRFASEKKTLQVICAVIFLIAFTVYVASAFVAGTSVFTMLFPGMSERLAMIIFALIIIGYTFLGGFKAVCWTDFFQGILMLLALLAVPILVAATQNLDTAALQTVYQYTDAGGSVVACEFGTGLFDASWQDIVSGLAWGLGYFGMPHIIIRFMSIEKPSMIKKSAAVAIVWVVLSIGAACLMAYYARMIVGEELLTTGAQKTVFIVMARKFFPPAIAGFLLAAIMAASVSTADSQLLVASSSFTSDLYKPLIRKDASDKEVLNMGRLAVIVIAVIAYFIASSNGAGAQAIMNLVENAWGIFGAAFGPVVLLSLFWRRFNYTGACVGVIVGAAVDIIWLALLSGTGVYELLPGFVAGGVAAIAATLCSAEPASDVTAIFDKAAAEDYNE